MKITEKIAEEIFDKIYEKLHEKFFDALSLEINEKLINDFFDIIADNLCDVSLRKKEDIEAFIKEVVSRNIDKVFDSVVCAYIDSQIANWAKEGKVKKIYTEDKNVESENNEGDEEDCDCPDCQAKRGEKDIVDLLNPSKRQKKLN
jgi:hypothetical protein